MDWARILAYITGTVNQELLLRNEYLAAEPERQRTTTWADFIRAHMSVLAGTDFFSVEVLTLRGLITYYVLFFIQLESRKVEVVGITPHPNEQWMKQIARNVTMDEWGFFEGKDNVLLFPVATKVPNCVEGSVSCKERLGGLLKYYHREAA